MDHSSPFFILANPRSGSSLFRIICECNKNLTVPPESGFLLWWHKKYSAYSINDLHNKAFIDQLIVDILSSKKIETWELSKDKLTEFIIKNQPQDYASLASLVYYFYAYSRGKSPKIWGDKNNYYIQHLDKLLSLYPKAKFIHLIRDGRDVACSYRDLKKLKSTSVYAPNLPFDIIEIANEWVTNIKKIDAFTSQLPKSQSLALKYEDVVSNLHKSAQQVCDFLAVDFDTNMLSYYTHNKNLALEPKQTLDWKKKTLQRPDISNIGKYLKELSEEKIADFDSIAKPVLKQYGYV